MTTSEIKSLQVSVSQMTDDALKAAFDATINLPDTDTNNIIVKATLTCEIAIRSAKSTK